MDYNKMSDAEFLSWIAKEFYGSDISPEEFEKNGYGYALTVLTDEEAQRLGAKAYLRRRSNG